MERFVANPQEITNSLRAPEPTLSIVLPCLNEEEAIGACLETLQKVRKRLAVCSEIVVCDNGSTDRSVEIMRGFDVRIVHEPVKGYGSAYLRGFSEARGTYLIMADADCTYDFNQIPEFLAELTDGSYDFVTGSRYLANGHANIKPLHRWFGNPALTWLVNILFSTRYTDVYCGYRAFKSSAYRKIKPVSRGMEFNLELAINAALAQLRIKEIPIELATRKGESKLRTYRDGWRSLRMMLLYSPDYVFLWPGTLLILAGGLLHILLMGDLLYFGGRPASAVTGVIATIFSAIGAQIVSFGLQVKFHSWARRFLRKSSWLARFYSNFRLERGLAWGALVTVLGMSILSVIFAIWLSDDMRPLNRPEWASLGATLTLWGLTLIFTSLQISAMAMERES